MPRQGSEQLRQLFYIRFSLTAPAPGGTVENPFRQKGSTLIALIDTGLRIDSLGKISGTKRCAAMSNRNPDWPFSGGLPHNNSANFAIFDLQLRVSETQHVCSGLDKM